MDNQTKAIFKHKRLDGDIENIFPVTHWEYIDGKETVENHINASNNPHGVTSDQVPYDKDQSVKEAIDNVRGYVDEKTSGPTLTYYAVTLKADSWENGEQIVHVDGIVADEKSQLLIPTPAIDNQAEYYAAGIIATNHAEGIITFSASSDPDSNITVYVITANVARALPPKGKTLEEYTWAEIDIISSAGKGAEYFELGDSKSVLVSGTVGTQEFNETYNVRIIGFDHDGDGGITFQGFWTDDGIAIALVDEKNGYGSDDGTKYFNINHNGNYNYGGWRACDLRYDILGSTDKQPDNYNDAKTSGCMGYDASETTATNPVENTLMAALPEDLRAVMKPMTVYTDGVAGGTYVAANVVATVDYLPLLAEYEIFGERQNANIYEQQSQKQYDYYKMLPSKVRYRASESNIVTYWFERSPYYYTGNYFCNVGILGNGVAGTRPASYSAGISPAFKI